MAVAEQLFSDAESLTTALAKRVCEGLEQAVAARGRASLVVSGGRTPRPLFETLAQRDLPWSQVHATLADERWVAVDSPDSNEGMLRPTLLQGRAATMHFVPLKNGAPDPTLGSAECASALAGLPWPLDLVLLGMGADGHTASLFPGAAGEALNPNCADTCRAVYPESAPHPRMSLTASALLASRVLILHFTGEDKLAVYRQAQQPGPPEQLPVRVILQQSKVPVELWWSP
jgi:6-phosphogluconolactonase